MDNTQPILAAWAASSSDATAVSNTIKGLTVAASSIIILTAGLYFHVQISSDDVLTFGTELGTTAGFIWFLAGLFLKGIHFVAKKRPMLLATPSANANITFAPTNNANTPIPTDAAA